MATIYHNGNQIAGGGVSIVHMTEAQYLANKQTLDASDLLIEITDKDYALTSDLIEYDNTESSLSASNIQNAITELDTSKLSDTLPLYAAGVDYSILTRRIQVITAIYNQLNLQTAEVKMYMANYSQNIRVRYTFWRTTYEAGDGNSYTKILVEEVCEQQGIYRQYYKLDNADFSQTLEYMNFPPAKTISACTPITKTGLTVTGFAINYTSEWLWCNVGRVAAGASNVTMTPDFQIDSYYYYILGTFGEDAETLYSSVVNDKIILSFNALYLSPSASSGITSMSISTHRIVKHDNKIYWCYRNNTNGWTMAAGFQLVIPPYPLHLKSLGVYFQ